MLINFAVPNVGRPARPNGWDFLAFGVVFSVLLIIMHARQGMEMPFVVGKTELAISLDPSHLPEYALRTSLRMGIALILSLVFSLAYAALAAKSAMAERLLIPVLDILQSVPILGFLSITVTGFIALFPGSLMGLECASIFAIFTSQAWNMTFSLYQSFRTVPLDLDEACRMFRASPWRKFWRLEVPFAMPQLIWNIMMSSAGGWFFVVASEAITVSGTQVALPGVGSYIAAAIDARDLAAIGYALIAMLIVILAVDQLVMRPLLVWSAKFQPSDQPGEEVRESWFYDALLKAAFLGWIGNALNAFSEAVSRLWPRQSGPGPRSRSLDERFFPGAGRAVDIAWSIGLVALAAYVLWALGRFVLTEIHPDEILRAPLLGFYTAVRVFVLIALASLIWVPIGVLVGLRPRLAQAVQPVVQILAAFPANLLFPLAVVLIHTTHANPEIWLSPLMILGTQWYILFNVIGGMSTMPVELQYAAQNFGARGWFWWRRVALPYVLPAYVTGAITASGGAWNASIVSEIVHWGDQTYSATGIGAYIAQYTESGDMPRVMLGIGVLCIYVTLLNRLLWRRLYGWAEERVRLG